MRGGDIRGLIEQSGKEVNEQLARVVSDHMNTNITNLNDYVFLDILTRPQVY